MRPLLKMLVILVCVQRGGGHWLKSLVGHTPQTPSLNAPPKDLRRNRGAAADNGPPEASGVSVILGRSRRSSPESLCGLRSVLLQVRDLGLGYDSDETILFKYCGGTCPQARSNHDLTLGNLLLAGLLPQPTPGTPWHSEPCCRPTHHEDVAFLDNLHRWHKVEKLSAAGCGCVD